MSLVQCTVILSLLFVSLPNAITAANILGLFINGHRSHLLVYTSVVRLLLERGHNITLVTTHDIENLSIDSEKLRHIQLSTNASWYSSKAEEENDTATLSSSSGLIKLQRMLGRIEKTSRFLEDPVWIKFLQERDDIATPAYDLMLLGYLFNDYQLGVAAHFNCPVAVIWTGQAIGFINSLMGNPEERLYVTQAYDRHQYTGVNALAFGIFEKAVELMALEVMQGIYDEHFPSVLYPSLSEVRKNVSLVLVNHHTISEGPIAPYVPGMIDIGGIQNSHKPNELSETLPLNTTEDILIYISFGSRIKWSAFLPATLNAFRDAFKQLTNYTIFWTYDGDCTALTANAPNIRCAQWWPQQAILARAKLFITHGGKGSISEALYHGVPILGVPIFGDQRANVAKLVKRGFALRLDMATLSKTRIIDAVEDLMENRTFANSVKQHSDLYQDRPLSAEVTAIFWIEYIIRHKGASHLYSPLRHLNAFQYYLIDVYAVILLIFVVLVLICNWLEKKLDAKVA